MNLSNHTTAVAITTFPAASPGVASPGVAAQEVSTAAASITLSPVDPRDHSRIDKYLDALGAPLRMGKDAQDIARALVSTMRALINTRPDLANAQFDFSSSDGVLVVSSAALGDSDKQWLQGQLNGNAALVQAVRSFHDDAVAGYAMWAEADGQPLSPARLESVSRQADGLTSFMNLFGKLGADAQQSLMTGGKYYRSDGSALDLGQDPSSAAGFLDFMRSADAAGLGTARFVTSSGKILDGVLGMNIFGMNSAAIPNFFPPSETRSLGVNETA